MGCNVGNTDKIVRFLLAAGALGASFAIGGAAAYVLWAVAAIMVLTSSISFCPIYKVLGLDTCAR